MSLSNVGKKEKKRKLANGTDGPSKFDTARAFTTRALVAHNPPDEVI
jgi:hypothetical protein